MGRDPKVQLEELMREIEDFLADPILNVQFVNNWRQITRVRLDLKAFTLSEGVLCAVCLSEYRCLHAAASTDACARCLQVMKRLNLHAQTTFGKKGVSPSRPGSSEQVKTWRQTQDQWRRHLGGLLIQRCDLSGRYDVPFDEWVELIGGQFSEWAERVMHSLRFLYPSGVAELPRLLDEEWILAIDEGEDE